MVDQRGETVYNITTLPGTADFSFYTRDHTSLTKEYYFVRNSPDQLNPLTWQGSVTVGRANCV